MKMSISPISAALGFAALAACAVPGIGIAACDATSGPTRAALVELYTSEACSSCPPADRLLGRMDALAGPGALAYPLALHVAYWDGPGWNDRFSQPAFSLRHRWLVERNHHSTVYTPHFFVDGAELQSLDAGALREAIVRANGEPSRATIHFSAAPSAGGRWHLSLTAQAPSGPAAPALYIAVAQNGLASNVTGGENGGEVLRHEHVVRTWIGPIALTGGEARVERDLPLPAGSASQALELVAFIEDEESGEVLQALGSRACGRTGG